MKYIFFTFFGLMGLITPCCGQEQRSLPKDSIPRGIITLKDTVLNGNSTTLVVFHDDKGNVAKTIGYTEFPDYSPFKNLPFPQIRNDKEVGEGETRYDLKTVSIEERLEVLKKYGIKTIDSSYMKRATAIRHFKRPAVVRHKNNDKFLLTSSYTEIANYEQNGASFCNSYISIYNYIGNIVKQLNVNASGNITMSSDAHFLLCESVTVIPGYEYSFEYGPYLLYDLKENKIDTIDIPIFHDRNIERPSFSTYGDSFFQIMYISRKNPNQLLHILVNPLTKCVFEKSYLVETLMNQDQFDSGFEFYSMRLPNGNRINFDDYLKK